MASGNFLVGNDGLTIEGFDYAVLPLLQKAGYSVPDKYESLNRAFVLISLIGKEDLEKTLAGVLNGEYRRLMDLTRKNGNPHQVVHAHQLSDYKTIGVYSDDQTASKMFASIALQIQTKNSADELDKLLETLRVTGKALSSS